VSDYDDDNIEFDFFEEPAPEPAPRRGLQRRPRRPDGPGRPPLRPAPGLTPLLRLLGLIAAAIAVVLLLAVFVRSCQATSKGDAYKHYMEKAALVGKSSQALGKQLSGILATPSLTEQKLEQQLNGLVTSGDHDLSDARALDPPGPLRPQHEDLLDALQLRQDALVGLLATFKKTAGEKKDDTIGAVLAQQTTLLAASDAVWQDLFQRASADTLERESVKGIAPPASVFLPKPDTLDATSLGNLWKRVHGSAVNSNTVRGTALVGVRAEPLGTVLSTTTATTMKATTETAFVISVKDTGELQEPNVKVTITLLQSPTPLVASGIIPLMNPGDTKTIRLKFKEFVPVFDHQLTLKVQITPVPHEARLGNNSAEYPVVFQV
jgi:hypothetical protein